VADGKPFVPKRYAAEYFLKKTRELIQTAETASFASEDVRSDVMENYKRAEALYAGLARGGK